MTMQARGLPAGELLDILDRSPTTDRPLSKEIRTWRTRILKGSRLPFWSKTTSSRSSYSSPDRPSIRLAPRHELCRPRGERVRGWNFTAWGDEFPVDVALDRAQPGDFDALLLPGGVMNPDTLRMQEKAVAFVKAFFDAGLFQTSPVVSKATMSRLPLRWWGSEPARRRLCDR
jgi:hypothetical protein